MQSTPDVEKENKHDQHRRTMSCMLCMLAMFLYVLLSPMFDDDDVVAQLLRSVESACLLLACVSVNRAPGELTCVRVPCPGGRSSRVGSHCG